MGQLKLKGQIIAMDADLTKLGLAWTTTKGEVKTALIKPKPKEFHFRKDMNALIDFYIRNIKKLIEKDDISLILDNKYYYEQAAQANMEHSNIVHKLYKSELIGAYRGMFNAKPIWVAELDKLLNYVPYNKKNNSLNENYFVVQDTTYARSIQGDKYRKEAIKSFVQLTLNKELEDKSEDEIDALFLLIYLLKEEKQNEV